MQHGRGDDSDEVGYLCWVFCGPRGCVRVRRVEGMVAVWGGLNSNEVGVVRAEGGIGGQQGALGVNLRWEGCWRWDWDASGEVGASYGVEGQQGRWCSGRLEGVQAGMQWGPTHVLQRPT